MSALHFIAHEKDAFVEDEIKELSLGYRNYVAYEVYRKLVDSQFKANKVSRKQREARQAIEAEAALWATIWRMLEVMDVRFNLLWMPIYKLFSMIVYECLLVCPIFLVKKQGRVSATNWFREVQPGINKQLQQAAKDGDRTLNPFQNDADSETFRFMDAAIFLAGKSDIFRDELFSRMVKERQKLIALHRSFQPRVVGAKKNQGRRTDIELKKLRRNRI